MDQVAEWIRTNDVLVAVAIALSVVAFLGGIIGVPFLLARLPADYFVVQRPEQRKHPVVHVVRNILAVIVILLGLAMLVLPGPGVIATLLGVSLLTFPGKRKLEIRILRSHHVCRAINWIRQRAKRAPLQFPESD